MKHARCPNCGQPAGAGRDNPWRPFCSERCRLIDLGEWLGGGRSIPAGADEATAPDQLVRNPDPTRH
jgi:hypothetical protein